MDGSSKALSKVSDAEEAKRKDDKINETQKEIQVSNPNPNKLNKILNCDKKVTINDEKIDEITTELLGSVTTHTCPGTRTSARVIQKMKLDLTRPTTPPPSINDRETKKDDKSLQKTPSQLKPHKTSWSNLERNLFFDGLNEYGKDFEQVGNYINSKLKRKSSTDISYKTKDQVRQHYYQTYHKICKYVRFSDEIKKIVQELYTLINYGEMRRKLQFVTDKNFMKLKHLIYKGHITVRYKGKNIRVKTPSCRALRKLNQLDDSLEDIRLPSKIEVVISPANMESFGRVQSLAQNPRVRTTVPLHKKLINFIKAFETKWKVNSKIRSFSEQATTTGSEINQQYYQDESEMCFLPKPNVTIHRPLLSITEYLSSVNLCLAAYEERMGIQIRSETLCMERNTTNKRHRTESGSEKRSPDMKKQKPLIISQKDEEKSDEALNLVTDVPCEKEDSQQVVMNSTHSTACNVSSQESDNIMKSESSGDELNEDQNTDTEILQDKEEPCSSKSCSKEEDQTSNEVAPCGLATSPVIGPVLAPSFPTSTNQNFSTSLPAPSQQIQNQQQRSKRSANLKPIRSSLNFKPLINDDIIKRIKKGWTVSNAADITIGDLYVVLGQDSRLELDYYWLKESLSKTSNKSLSSNDVEQSESFKQSHLRLPYNAIDCNDNDLLDKVSQASIGNKLKHLLLIANLSDRIRKRHCSCGHVCERNASKPKMERDYSLKQSLYNKNFPSTSSDHVIFRQPYPPVRRQIFCPDPVKQLSTLTRQKMSRQVLVQRLLLPGAAGNQSYDILNSRSTAYNIQEQKADEKNYQPNLQLEEKEDSNNKESEEGLPSMIEDYELPVSSELNGNQNGNEEKKNIIPNEIEKASSELLLNSNCSESQEERPFDDVIDGFNNDDILLNTPKYPETPSGMQTPRPLYPSSFDEGSSTTNSIFNGLFSPMQLFRDTSSNSRWLEDNLNDFSLTSLLGHLDEISSSRDAMNSSSNISVISESSVDYRHKFQEISALMQNQDKDKTSDD